MQNHARARTTTHVDVRRTCACVDVRGRMSLQLHAILKYNANYSDTAWYCAILRELKLQQKSRNTTHKSSTNLCVKARARTYVAAVSESAVIEINVFD